MRPHVDARPLADASFSELAVELLTSARALAIEELALAVLEAKREVLALRRACVLFVASGFVLGAAIAWAGVALGMAFHLGALGMALVALVAAIGAALLAWLGRRSLPTQPLPDTRARLARFAPTHALEAPR